MPFSSVLYSQMVPQGGLLSLLMESLKYMTPFLVFQSKPLGSCTPSGPNSCNVCKKWLEMVPKYSLHFSSNSFLFFSFASCRCGKSSKHLYQCYLHGTCSNCMQLIRSASLSLTTPLTSSQTDRAWLYACKAYMFKYKLAPTHRHMYNAEIMLMLCTHVFNSCTMHVGSSTRYLMQHINVLCVPSTALCAVRDLCFTCTKRLLVISLCHSSLYQ